MEETNKNASAVRLLKNNVREIIRLNRCQSKGVRSLAQLAEAMNISAPTLTHALNGNPRLDTLQKIAEALNVPITSLFNEPRQIYGEVVIDGKVLHFHSMEELQDAIKPKSYNFGLT